MLHIIFAATALLKRLNVASSSGKTSFAKQSTVYHRGTTQLQPLPLLVVRVKIVLISAILFCLEG